MAAAGRRADGRMDRDELHRPVFGALRHQHVFPELRRRRDRQMQRPMVPCARARRIRRDLRDPDIPRDLFRVRRRLHHPRARRDRLGLPHASDPPRHLLGHRLADGERHPR